MPCYLLYITRASLGRQSLKLQTVCHCVWSTKRKGGGGGDPGDWEQEFTGCCDLGRKLKEVERFWKVSVHKFNRLKTMMKMSKLCSHISIELVNGHIE